MWLIVGLGNPGAKYILTRHNVGFMVLDVLCNQASCTWKAEHQAEVAKAHLEAQSVLLAKPQTFMNRSGESVRSLASFYKMAPNQILVIHDDIDQNLGSIKFQYARGHGGHNGVRSIHEQLGTDQYYRLKIGVGKPAAESQINVADFVLQNFSKEEQKLVPQILEHCYKGILSLLSLGFAKTASLYNKNLFPSQE